MIEAAVENFIRPGWRALHRQATALKSSTENLCATPSPAALKTTRAAFSDTVRAWSRVELVRIGPIMEENRLERFLYWPDRKGIGLKQVQAALARQDESVTDPARLAGKSVAMQGLGALEFILFATGSEQLAAGQAFRCSYGAAIADNLVTMAAAIEKGWDDPQGFVALWTRPSPDNPLYRDDREAMNDLLEILVTGLELVRDQRVGSFLGQTEQADKPAQALFRRSQATFISLGGNMAGMKALFASSGLAASLPPQADWIANSIHFEFNNAISAVNGLDGTIEAILGDPRRRDRLGYFKLVTSSLSELFGTRLSGALGLTAGFSSLDGD